MADEDFFKKPPKRQGDDTEVKPVSENCVLYVHDEGADGVVIDCENKPTGRPNHVRMDFEESTNLELTVSEAAGVTQVDEHKCAFDIKPGEFKRIIWLKVVDLDEGSYDLRYKLQGFFRNAQGDLTDAKGNAVAGEPGAAGKQTGGSAGGSSGGAAPAAPAAAVAAGPAGASVSGEIARKGAGGAAAAPAAAAHAAAAAAAPASSASAAASAADDGDSPFEGMEYEEEFKKVNDNIQLKLLHFEGSGYEFVVVTTAQCPGTLLSLDASASENLTCKTLPAAESAGEGKLTVKIPPGAHEIHICRLTMTDEDGEGYGMSYKVSAKVDSSITGGNNQASGEMLKKKGAGEDEAAAAAKKAADDKAAADAAAAKKKAEADAAAAVVAQGEALKKKKQQEEEDAAKKADEARIAGELARKKREEEEAKKKKQDEEDRAKKATAAEQKKKADEEAQKKREEMMARAKEQAEKAQRDEEEKARKKAEWEDERKKVAAAHEAQEKVLYGELEARKLTPFEQREVDEAEKAAAKEADDFAKDAAAKDPKLNKEALAKTYKWYAFVKRRYEIEWRLRFLLIERMFYEKMCQLCRGFLEGEAFTYKDKTGKQFRLHQQCYDQAPKCDMCHDVLIGAYTMTKGDNPTRLHNGECLQKYKESNRPSCATCGKKIVNEDKWVTVGEQHFHTACKK